MKITLTNDFHGTETVARVIEKDGNATLSPRQVKRINAALCCSGCTCSGALGTRGYQHAFDVSQQDQDGSVKIHLRGY